MKELSTLQLLEYFKGCVFQTFSDTEDNENGCARVFLDYEEETFRRLNKNRNGIFFSANAFEGERKTDHLTKLLSFYCDADFCKESDGLSSEERKRKRKVLLKEILDAPVKPNIVTITKNGLQPFWLIDEDRTDTKTQERWKNTQEGIVEYFAKRGSTGDIVKDIARVLRLPGFYHQKGEPFLIRSYLIHEEKTTLREMEQAFPYFDKSLIELENAKTKDKTDKLANISMEDIALRALAEYGEASAYFDRSGRIVLSRGVTGAFLGKEGDAGDYIASTSHELPHGNKVTFPMRLLNIPSTKEAFKWICKEFNVPDSKNTRSKTKVNSKPLDFTPRLYSKMSDKDILEVEDVAYLQTGIEDMDERFGFPAGFYVVCGNPGTGKGFLAAWFSKQFYLNNQKKSVLFSLEMSEELVRRRVLQSWSNLTQKEFEAGGSVQKGLELLKQDFFVVEQFSPEDTSCRTPENFKKLVDNYYNQGYRIFHFDHFHELEGATVNETNFAVVDAWGSVFQEISKKYPDIWLFVFAQPNGAAAKKELLSKTDISGSKALTQKCDVFLSLNRKIATDEYDKVTVSEEDRSAVLWVDKNRLTSKQYIGFRLYFAETGNFYKSETEAALALKEELAASSLSNEESQLFYELGVKP